MLPFYGRKLSRNKKKFNYKDLESSPFFFDKLNFKDLELRIKEKPSLVNLEIGYGTGDNIILQSEERKKEIFIACDPFLSGAVKLMKKIKLYSSKNVYFTDLEFWNLFKLIRNLRFNKIYVLFPDPWPKKKHNKRRLINNEFVKKLKIITTDESKIFLATDDQDYSNQILKCFLEERFFKLLGLNQKNLKFNDVDLFPTKYYNKAIIEQKKINFFIFKK
tara:strand:+ start:59 stop:715 length:657 start_codon:yes stop_codon:yes gene_type:complete